MQFWEDFLFQMLSLSPGPAQLRAMTLIEVTLVLSTLLGLVGVAFVGTTSYKNGANRALCVHQVANVQKAMRCYCNFYELEPCQPIPDLKKRIIQDSKFFYVEPTCPSKGVYTYFKGSVPNIGELFIQCSIPDHSPKNTYSW